ncbi:hypothetical protein SAMN04489712_10436 [Thermomonospora echinospora]|uniref:Uncharacterized protein n=1 Tax=Thermomonospora echinospora TaxID=1992 RepID=A0A1H5YKN0_9ACTN|nr:hypothetical protein [Thermomonospora echinospora]SEG23936.1 hypothetical protein SAMN04489712_10436 [Thermomonospora echinospora]
MSAEVTAGHGPRRSPLERRYEALLRIYPAAFRDRHGADIIGTLMETSTPGRRVPSPRETASLIREGLAARARQATESPVRWWADGLHLGVLILAVVHLVHVGADIVLQGRSSWPWVAVSMALTLALLRGRLWAALPLALGSAFVVSRAMLFGYAASADWPLLSNATVYHSWISLTPYWLMAAGVVVLAARRSRELQPRSWWWLALPVATFAGDALLGVDLYSELGSLGRAGLEGGLLLAGIWVTTVTRSPRWALAAAIYVLPGELSTIADLPQTLKSPMVTAYWAVLAVLLLAMAWIASRVRTDTGSGA